MGLALTNLKYYLNKMGGLKMVMHYVKSHIFTYACLQVLINGTSKKSLEIVRLALSNKILKRLRKKNRKLCLKYKNSLNEQKLIKERSNKVWICWFQGIGKEPFIVNACYKSIKDNIKNKDIILITDNNYKDYITFPSYIQEKIDKGIITKTHLSDLLRLELLIKYGGTWIDSTVYCSGSNIPDYILNSDLFLYQCLKPGLDGEPLRISSWLITSTTNNEILLLTRELLYNYWKRNNYLIDYYLFHNFFELAIETYPEIWDKVVPTSNSVPHILLLRLFDKYDEYMWNEIKNMTCFHKLSYKLDTKSLEIKDTYYKNIFCNQK